MMIGTGRTHMNKINRWFYYRFARLSVRAKWSRVNLSELSKVQERTMKITLALMYDSDTEMLINPRVDEKVGEKYYIKKFNENNEPSVFVTISKNSNGYIFNIIGDEEIDGKEIRYHYDIWFNENYGNYVLEKFKRILRRRRNKMEQEIRKGDEETLDLILKKLEK